MRANSSFVEKLLDSLGIGGRHDEIYMQSYLIRKEYEADPEGG